MNIVPLFQRDPSSGVLIPKLTEGCDWVRQGLGMSSIWIDGILLKNKGTLHDRTWWRQVKAKDNLKYWLQLDEKVEDDKPLLAAIKSDPYCATGKFIAAGPGINGNPQNMEKPKIFRIHPVDAAIFLGANHTIKRNKDVKPEELFEAILFELSHPETDAMGIVYHWEVWEQGKCELKMCAGVKRQDFGLDWPIKPKAQVPVTTQNYDWDPMWGV